MLRASALALLLMVAAGAARAEDGPTGHAGWPLGEDVTGPARWLVEQRDDLTLLPVPAAPTSYADPLSRFIAYCKRNPVGVRPLVTLLPPDAAEDGAPEL